MRSRICLLALLLGLIASAPAAENLQLNPRLDYNTDSHDGPLITGAKMSEGAVAGVPNYVIIYGEGCFNSKRQARRTVELYDRYRGRVHFVIIDLDTSLSAAQQELVDRHFHGRIPHVVILDKRGKAIYDRSGEVEIEQISPLLDAALK